MRMSALPVLWVAWMGVAQAASVAEADQLYRSGKYAEAARQLTELALENPTDAELYERLGAARYRAGDFEGAARAFDQAHRLKGGDADALFNSGNAHYQAGRLEEALERYDQVLEHAPEHPGAKQNKELLVQELEARRKEPPPPPPPQGGGGDEQQQPQSGEQPPPDGGGQQQQPQGESNQEGQGGGQSSGEQQPGQPGQDEGSGVADLDELEGEPRDGDEPVNGGEGSEAYEESAPITSGEAHRLLDGVEEGEHRVRIGGNGGGKPW